MESGEQHEEDVDLIQWASSEEVAVSRYMTWRDRDPFPSIPPALLGRAAVIEYVRVTGMVHPFAGWDAKNSEPNRDLLKPASYEINPGKVFYRFDEKGELIRSDLTEEGGDRLIRLPRNSISFASTAETLRLPNYIAARFNLRIKHVHRGILLGTGPLVDPGYDLPLLIPLHNLTDQDYFIGLDEGLIWVEFTKAYPYPGKDLWESAGEKALPNRTRKGFEQYLIAAGGGVPIRSSIPQTVEAVTRLSENVEKRIDGFSQKLNAIGVVGIVALVITVASLLIPTLDLIRSSDARVEEARKELRELQRKVDGLTASPNSTNSSARTNQ